MAITYIGSAIAESNSATLPSWSTGDIAIVLAYNTASTTIPTVPSGWSPIYSGSTLGSRAYIGGYRVLQGGDTSTGTWTNASKVSVAVYRGTLLSAPIDATTSAVYEGALTSTPNGVDPAVHDSTYVIGISLSLTATFTSAATWTADNSTGTVLAVVHNSSYSTNNWSYSASDYIVSMTVGLRDATYSGFPIIADPDTTSGTVTSNSSSWTLTYPTNIAAGDLLIAAQAGDGGPGAGGTWPSGWEDVGDTSGNYRGSGANFLVVKRKVANGTESGNFTVTIANSANEQGSWTVWRIPVGTWDNTDLSDPFNIGTDTNPDPPSLNPSISWWDLGYTLWLAVMSADTSRTVSAYPSSPDTFTDTGSLVSGGSNGATLAWGRLEKNASSVDPGTFTISNSDDWVAATIAIRGAARTGSFSIAAEISSGAKTGNFKADAVVKKTQTGSFGVAAVIKRTWGGARYSDLILAHKPIGYWRLGESSGSPQDSSGRGNHMTTVNGTPDYSQPSLITGDANTSVGLVASSSESFNSGGSWDFDLGDVGSIEAWVKLAATGGGEQIIFSRQSGYAIGISAITTDRIFFAKAGYAVLCESTVTLDTERHHIVATKNGTASKIYLDGQDVTGTVTDAPFGTGYYAVNIGQDSSANSYWNGLVDEVAFYPKTLTQYEVVSHFNSGVGSSAGFAADAVIKRTQEGSFPVASVLKKTINPTFAVDAVLKKTMQPYRGVVLGDLPVAYWRLGEASGNPQDSAGTYNVSATAGTPTYGVAGALTGDSNTAVDLNGSAAYFTVTHAAAINPTQNFSIEVWAKPDSGPTGSSRFIVSKGSGGSYFLSFNHDSGKFRFGSNSGVIFAYGAASVGNWHHVVATYATATDSAKIYVDGRDVTEAGTGGTFTGNTSDLTVGSEAGGGLWDGSLDELAIYNSVLSSSQIATHYITGKGGIVGFAVQAQLVRTVSGSFVAAAVLKKTISGTFALDAVLKKSLSGSTPVAAITKKTQSGSFIAASILKKTISGSFAADAVKKRTMSGSYATDAITKRTQTGSFPIAATLFTSHGGPTDPHTFTADAWIKSIRTGSFAVAAVLKSTLAGSFKADAVLKRTMAGSATADAILKKTQSGSTPIAAITKATISGSFAVDSVLKKTIESSFPVEYNWVNTRESSFTIAAVLKKTIVAQGGYTVVVQDSFTDTDSTWIEDHTPEVGGPWASDGSFNAYVYGNTASGGTAHATQGTYLDVDVLGTLTNPASNSLKGVGARMTGSGDSDVGYAVIYNGDGGSHSLYTVEGLSPAWSWLADGEGTGNRIRLQVRGANPTSIRVRAWDPSGPEPETWGIDITDSTSGLQVAGYVGIFDRDTNPGLDNFLATIPAGGQTLDAVLAKTQSGTFSADAVLFKTLGADGSLGFPVAAEKAGQVTYESSFKADAVLWKTITNLTFAVAAWLQQTNTGSFTAAAVLKRTQSGSISIDAVIKATRSGSFATDAVLKKTPSGSFGVAAVLQKTGSGSFAVEAVTKATISGSFAVAAITKKTLAGSFALDAVLQKSGSGSFAVAAVAKATLAGSFTSDAVLFSSRTGTFPVAAVIKRLDQPGSFAAAATLTVTQSGSTKVDAVLTKTQAGSLSVAAVITSTGTGSFPAQATFTQTTSGSFALDATFHVEGSGSFDIAAIRVSVGRAMWTTPENYVQIPDTPTLAFTMPSAHGNMHFQMELDLVDTFDSGDLRVHLSSVDQTGWEYWNGGSWQAVPWDGVPDTYAGNEARYTLQTPLDTGTWYRRVRAGVI